MRCKSIVFFCAYHFALYPANLLLELRNGAANKKGRENKFKPRLIELIAGFIYSSGCRRALRDQKLLDTFLVDFFPLKLA